jgi:hypothetical protein
MARGEWAAGTLDTKKFEREEEANGKKHLSLMEAFRCHPGYMNYIKELQLSFCITDPAHDEDQFTLDTVHVLRNSRNLQTLDIGSYWRHDDPCEKHTRWVLSHVSPDVTVLHLKASSLSAKTILSLLNRLPKLEQLTLGNDATLGQWRSQSYCDSPKLVHLKQLQLLPPFHSKPFLQKILAHTPSLAGIVASPFSVQALDVGALCTLSRLMIQGNFALFSLSHQYSASSFVSDLIDTLRRCPALKGFGLAVTYEEEEETDATNSQTLGVSRLLVQADFLQYLPRSLDTLVLLDTALDPRYITSYINGLGSSHHLQLLKVSLLEKKWWGADENERARLEASIDRACEKNGDIALEWYSGGKRVSRGADITLDELKKVFAGIQAKLDSPEWGVVECTEEDGEESRGLLKFVKRRAAGEFDAAKEASAEIEEVADGDGYGEEDETSEEDEVGSDLE